MKTKSLLTILALLLLAAVVVTAQQINTDDQRAHLRARLFSIGRTAPSPAPAGRFMLHAAPVEYLSPTGSRTHPAVFKLDTATGQTWIYRETNLGDGKWAQDWLHLPNQEDEAEAAAIRAALRKIGDPIAEARGK